ncbi:MAG: DUF4276 family protein [Sulfuricellaceae bacterium]
MTRLLVHVEGQTEETFVNEVLRDHLLGKGYERVSARLVGNARLRARRGGIRAWSAVREDILGHLHEDRGCVATTFVDYYALPRSGGKAWPGRLEAGLLPHHQKAAKVENALLDDIVCAMDSDFDPRRFVPFVVMHEFEALLFSDCQAFARGICQERLAPEFQAVRDQFETPEHINDSPMTAPSKRVEKLVSGYEKPLLGNLAVLEIGLEPIRKACPHFNAWLTRLDFAAGLFPQSH